MNLKNTNTKAGRLNFATAASFAMILISGTPSQAQWSLTGNGGTNPKVNFLGTKDKQSLVIRTNNKERVTIAQYGNVGIGTTNPKYNLHIYSDSAAHVAIISKAGAGASLIMDKDHYSKSAYVSYRTNGTGIWQEGTLGSNDFSIKNLPLNKTALNIDRYTNNVAIGVSNASDNSILEVASKTKGVLLPRMLETERLAIVNPSEGLTVFQTNAGGGYYYYHDSNWVAMHTKANSWNLQGNGGTNSATDFIGTVNNENLNLRTNNKNRLTIAANGNVGIGTTNPAYNLQVRGDSSARLSIISNGSKGAALLIEKASYAEDAFVAYRTNGTGIWQAGTLGTNDYTIRNLPLGKTAFTIDRYTNNVAIGVYNASNDAILEVASKSKGVLLPRMQEADRLAIINPSEGLTVYQTNAAAGYYYVHNSTWIPMKSDFNGWNLDGNGGLNPNLAFIGTTDSIPLIFKVNNTVAGRLGITGANTSFGLNSYSASSTGYGNTAIGANALLSNVSGNLNSCFGKDADIQAQVNNATAIGYNAHVAANNSVKIGNTSVNSIGGQVSWTNYSDARIKNNVKENVPGLEFIKALRPVTYHFDVNKENELLGITNSENFEGKYDIEKVQYSGFLAQEVDAAAKNIGYDFSGVDKSQKVMGLRYSEFVVPMVKAIQQVDKNTIDLNDRLQTLELENASLKNELNDMKQCLETLCNNATSAKQTSTNATSNKLEQNQPNPFSINTVINYFINEKNANATIVIRDLNGHLVKELGLNNGAGNVTISANSLTEGTYTYSLFVNDKCVDTKLMVLTK